MKAEISRRDSKIELGEDINCSMSASEVLDILNRTWDDWNPKYYNYKNDIDIEIVFIHLMLYNDDFGWLGNGKAQRKQTNVLLTPIQLVAKARQNEKDIGSIVLMLAPTNALNHFGFDVLLKLHTMDIRNLAFGEFFEISGKRYLVFAFVPFINGTF